MGNIKLIILDVDGTLTDGQITIGSDGKEYKNFNVKDGMAISQSINCNIDVAILTGRTSQIVDIRAKELGISDVFQGLKNKIDKVRELANKYQIKLEEVAYIGDDINDLEAMKLVGFRGCPLDASIEVKDISDFISSQKGGNGAVREIIEHILKQQGLWEKIVNSFKYTNQ
jgi:3-deoxy-D-manno-octulosonate 8-phosphate phosphatase (KDO 8-P phosphatase)